MTKCDFDLLEGFKKKVFPSANFSIKVYRSDFSPSRFAVVLSSKTIKKAVERNKKKRQIRNIILKNKSLFQDGFTVVIYPKKTIKERDFVSMEKELDNLFKKSDILKC